MHKAKNSVHIYRKQSIKNILLINYVPNIQITDFQLSTLEDKTCNNSNPVTKSNLKSNQRKQTLKKILLIQ